MPIYDQGYRRHEARGTLSQVRFWPITREALRLIVAKRLFLVLVAVSWIPFLVRAVQVYVVTRFPQAGRLLPVDGTLFGDFLNQQIWFTILLSVFGGAGLIANDLRTGGILVYLSRPLTRRDYVLGKLGVVLGLNLSATLVPALLLYLVALALAPDQFQTWSLAWIGPAVVAHALLISLVISLVLLAVSALSHRASFAGLGFVLLLVGLGTISTVLRKIVRQPSVGMLSIWADLERVGMAMFDSGGKHAMPWPGAAAMLVVVALCCLAILRTRVRAVEIVR